MSDSSRDEETGIRKLKSAALRFFLRWGAWPAFAAIIVCTIYERLSVQKDPSVELAFFGAMIILVFEQVESSNSRLEKLNKENLQAAKLIMTAVTPKLFTLEECTRDIQKRLQELPRDQNITVRHFGLDMLHAWDRVSKLLSDKKFQANVNYKILMISSDSAKLGDVDRDISELSNNVLRILPKIKDEASDLVAKYRSAGRQLEISCKEYAFQPFIHGIEIRGLETVCYISICRWSVGGKYSFDWGQDSYYRIFRPSGDIVQDDLYTIFDTFFDRHWHANPLTSVHVSSATSN